MKATIQLSEAEVCSIIRQYVLKSTKVEKVISTTPVAVASKFNGFDIVVEICDMSTVTG